MTPILQFIFFTILTCPPNFLYQQTLESLFPSTHLAPSNDAIKAAGDGDEKKLATTPTTQLVQPKLNVKNTLTKFLLDQSFGAALNTLAFIYVMGGLQGQTWEMVNERSAREFWPMMWASYRLWPMVSLLGYAGLKSVEARQLLGSCAGLGWNIFLSLKAGAGAPAARSSAAKGAPLKEL